MYYEENIEKIRPGLTPFPENIFVDDQPWLSEHLLPLLSIDLGVLRSELAGTVVHMLSILDSFQGYIGDGTTEFHNEFTAPNWFALQLTDDNRYRFLGREGYFAPHLPEDEEYYAAVKATIIKARAYAKEHGRLASFPMSGDGKPREREWLGQLGGEPWYGNWTMENPPEAFTLTEEEISKLETRIEITYQGKPFLYVAYTGSSASTLMFYEPESRIVLFTFDYD